MNKINNVLLANQGGKPSRQIDISTSNRIDQRYQMVVLERAGINRQTIAWFVNRHINTVRRWISRTKSGDQLCDQERSGRPPVFAEDAQLKSVAFYCQVSPLPGCNTWSFRWAQQYLQEHHEILGCSISGSTLQRILKKHALRPHLHKYFLAITDPDFFPKMEHIINLCLNQPEYLFNFDECTGLQAKAPAAPQLPVQPGKPMYEEFEYTRNGTVDLMAFLDPKTGKVFGRCTPNHNTQTLLRVFTEHVHSLPLQSGNTSTRRDVRKNQWQHIRDQLNKRNYPPDEPIIVTGDMNTFEGEMEIMRSILKGAENKVPVHPTLKFSHSASNNYYTQGPKDDGSGAIGIGVSVM